MKSDYVELSPRNRVMCLAVNNGAGARILLNYCHRCPANQSCQKLHAKMKGGK